MHSAATTKECVEPQNEGDLGADDPQFRKGQRKHEKGKETR